ncbi:MAG: hypothetical protein WCP06_11780 [Verrucomicrobiota bacterium]
MGFLKLFSKPAAPRLETLLSGSMAITRTGGIVASTLPNALPPETTRQIGNVMLKAFANASESNLPFSDLILQFEGFKIVARNLRGGALFFLQPGNPSTSTLTLPAMSTHNLDEFLNYLETYVECWKQFNQYVNLARSGKFSAEDETQFLEVKSLITQGLEVVLAAVESGGPRKDEVMALVVSAPSIRHLAENENNIATVETQWHKAYLTLQSLLGRLKVQQQKQEGEWSWGSLFR